MTESYAVVVPVKGRPELTADLLNDLRRDGGYARIWIFDNGSDPDDVRAVAEEVARTPRCDLMFMEGVGIHSMWNTGLRMARGERIPLTAILNNDLRLGPGCLDRLAGVFADERVGLACPNYDGRPEQGLVDVDRVCGGLYDGTGGMAGFAFMLRSHGYRFPEELRWWFGDQHVLASTLARGRRAVIVTDATVEHVGGGSQTGDWDSPSMQRQLMHDERMARRLVVR